jgi:hypothetical protein
VICIMRQSLETGKLSCRLLKIVAINCSKQMWYIELKVQIRVQSFILQIGRSALHWSCVKGHYEIVKILVLNGSPWDTFDKVRLFSLEIIHNHFTGWTRTTSFGSKGWSC